MQYFGLALLALAASMIAVPASAQTAPATTVAPAAPHQDVSDFAERIRPFLRGSGKAGRVYYRAVCYADNGPFFSVGFPIIELRTPTRGARGAEAIRQMLPSDAIVEEKAGIVSIHLGSPPTQLLDTQIGSIPFMPEDQYNAPLAMILIEQNPEARAAAQWLGYYPPVEDMSVLVASPAEGLPHLPPSLSNMTLDQIYDRVAKTFGGVVFFGVCEDQHLYLAQYAW